MTHFVYVNTTKETVEYDHRNSHRFRLGWSVKNWSQLWIRKQSISTPSSDRFGRTVIKTAFRKVFEFDNLWLLKALFNREVDCIDCELIPVTVTSCKFEPFDQDDSVTGKTTAIVKSRDQNWLQQKGLKFNR